VNAATQHRKLFLRTFAIGALATAVLLPVTMRGASAQVTDVAADEAEFVRLINELRASKGAGPLTVHEELVRVARPWTVKMKAAGEISHNPDLAKQVNANWRKLGENVGVGPTVPMLHDAFVKSPAHLKNLLDPAFDSIGITIEYDGDVFYVTEQFMDIAADSAAPKTSTAPAPQAQSSAVPNELALKKPVKKIVKKVVKKPVAVKSTPK
jgi:Cysteine-rich secretory protein family